MKTKFEVFLAGFFTLAIASSSQAQITTNPLPVVTIHNARNTVEGGVSGLFTLFRDGPTNSTLNVTYALSGTASNGVDYALLSGVATIPAGLRSANIEVSPIDDSVVEGPETVVATLIPPPTAGAPTYLIGVLSNAVLTISDNDGLTNHPPTVRMLSPTNGATFFSPVDIPLIASAQDAEDGYNITVEFFAGTNSLGFGTFIPSLCPAPWCPNFSLTWSNVAPGNYLVTARATDKNGAQTTSEPIHITVYPGGLPVVTIVATDPSAYEGPVSSNTDNNTGTFTVYRAGPTNSDLMVLLHIGGSASNGVDYSFISNSVVIPAGSSYAKILVNPIDDTVIEGTETVEVAIEPIACVAIFPPPPGCYQPGYPSAAVVFIADNDRITNVPPRVHITSPTNNSAFNGPLDLPITAEAADPDDDVVRVDFFANDHFLGSVTGTNLGSYGIVWSNALPGLYLLQARGLDSRGAVGLADPVRIAILGTNVPPTLPPIVTIFAIDPIAAEGTNWSRWYSNSIGALPPDYPTNTATFLVRRAGPTNAALIVNYRIGGTASNGVDYAALPGVVTIPAGERSARVTIYPIDDLVAECPETVILSLVQPTNQPQPYLVGWPPKAAAVIVDNDQPPPDTRLLCDGIFHLCLPATNGFTYRLECSLDLLHWLPVGTNTVTDLGIHFVDPESLDFPNRYYRVLSQPTP